MGVCPAHLSATLITLHSLSSRTLQINVSEKIHTINKIQHLCHFGVDTVTNSALPVVTCESIHPCVVRGLSD